ncbi:MULTISPECIES: hypothetical protein [unclassified Mesorhizobium]|nr:MULTISPECIES: hypothetical protein [unclassified Mesorhizobium]MCT2579775.1 hypothetical protein [Mesorhizobium sp. P13.3]MDF3168866.1 hypothetical protein [Mesorhizobium sp. P16.1]MDF3178586.1 hypothetical protein [Mesorhizobium sp. P17.1]MDF3185779.1 hypothetical protein [Mesorhizobium sp. ICCV3110.1]
MRMLKKLLRHLWRRKIQPAANPSPVDAIVRLLRESEERNG